MTFPLHEPPSPDGFASPQDALLMLVDDEPLNVEMLRGHLEDAGYGRFVSTSDAREALALARRHLPDVLLLDLSMPGIDGLEILSALRAEPELAHTPVLMVTASTDHAAKLRALEGGATDFLSKPVDPIELVLRLKNTLAAKAHIERLALVDLATGLPNRAALARRLQGAVDAAVRHGTCAVLIHLALDGFGEVNEAFGPQVGDAVLRAVAERLALALRSSDAIGRAVAGAPTVARHAGDEFIVLLPHVRSAEDGSVVAQRLQQAIAGPLPVAGNQLALGCSVGIAVVPRDGLEAGDLLERAAAAMRLARRSGRDQVHYYSADLNEQSLRRLQLASDLRRGIGRDELVVHYQPKCDVGGGWTGAEALVRWQHPRSGLLGPAEFVPLAEESGLIVDLGTWVLRQVAKQLREWSAAGLRPPRVAVNVSPHQLRSGRLLDEVDALIGDWAPVGRLLCLELTEGVLLDRDPGTVRLLYALRERGIRLSIDDFGTGYSSLSYLQQLPFDELKIDRSFVSAIESQATLVQAIIAMAHALGLGVVAEGVETAGQLQRLREQGCDEFQGYFAARPMPAADFAAGLLDSRTVGTT